VAEPIRVLCVDDNATVGEAIASKLQRVEGMSGIGWLGEAGALVQVVSAECPDIVVLDLDMPGMSPFSAMEELAQACPRTRVVVFSGHVRAELIDRAMEAGAWGYVSKNDGEENLVWAVREAAAGRVALGNEVRAVYTRGGA
jgi:DNA-binding NarL/FixJ family response regulator